jgi:hypothetical protein
VESVVTEVILGDLLQEVLRFYLVTNISSKLHTNRHNLERTNGRSLGAFQKKCFTKRGKIKKEKYFSGCSGLRSPY